MFEAYFFISFFIKTFSPTSVNQDSKSFPYEVGFSPM